MWQNCSQAPLNRPESKGLGFKFMLMINYRQKLYYYFYASLRATYGWAMFLGNNRSFMRINDYEKNKRK